LNEEGERVGPGFRLKEEGRGLVFIVSAPSGAGKTTLIRRVMEQLGGLQFSISYTTRLPRANEVEGRDYHFITPDLFRKMVEKGEFWEWAEVLGNHYGTARPSLEALNSGGMDLLLDIDTQGARKVLEQVEGAISVFILPPSPEVLRERLVRRGLDAHNIIERRLSNAKKEIEEAHRYHYVILNDRLEEAVEVLKAVILAERCRKEKGSIFKKKLEEWEAYYGKNNR
jgi:guanylate kinase